ncbi:MAG: 2'-5' RNA ligase family protein [Candidatus Pacearchaeota archaeon]|jgi:2'-5' RNA ligase
MKQVISIILKKDKQIEKFRKKFGTDVKTFKPHVNMVYPFEVSDQDKLREHIENSLKDIKKFKLTLKGIKKSAKGYYLYLLVDKGKKDLLKMYKNLHKGLLKNFKNKDMPKYIPHLSMGNFSSKKEIDSAMKELKKENLFLETEIKSIQVLTISKNHKLKGIKNFKLN